MDALKLLESDHRDVASLLERLEAVAERDSTQRRDLFQDLVELLRAHEAMANEVFYPALERHPEARPLAGYEEVGLVDRMLLELQTVPHGDESWGAKLRLMRENIENHIEGEEQKVFANVRKVVDERTRAALGERMERRKEELMGAPA